MRGTPLVPESTRLIAWGKLRDAVLFGATFVYALGYLAWCVYAWRHDLGLLPPLEGQYFIAGFAPGILLVLGQGLFSRLVPASTPHDRDVARRRAIIACILGFVVGIVGWIGQETEGLGNSTLAVLFWTGFSLVGLTCYFTVRGEEIPSFGLRGFFAVAITALVISTFVLYAAQIFPSVPKPFGGPGPECVALDVDGGELSRELRVYLTGASRSDVIQSRPLWLYFEGNDYIFLRSERGPRAVVIRVRATSVRAIVPSSGCPTGTS